MSQADALLESLAATAASEPVVEGDNIVIGTDRFWSVPEKVKKIGVQFDHDIETITFDCPRYWDGHDMSKMKIYVNYMRADGGTGLYWCENVRVDETDDTIMHFDWTISANATLVQGSLSALVCIKKTGTDGNEVNHWNSELCTELYVSEGMQCSETPLRKYPDIITQLLTRMEAAEFEVSPGEVVKKINQALTTNATTQETVAQVAQEYVNNEPAIVYIQNTADTALSIAEGANQALCFATYADMIASFNAFEKGKFRDGQNVYIATVGVPDLWIYSCEETSVPYTYTDDQTIVEVVGNGGTIQAGYYKLGPLETQNVKLRDVAIPLLLDKWDDNLSQTIEVDGIGEDSNPIVMLSYTGEEASDAVLYSYACIKDIDVSTNSIRFTCSEKPKASFTVIVKSVMVNLGSVATDVTAVVDKVNQFEADYTEVLAGGKVKFRVVDGELEYSVYTEEV